MVRLFNLDFAKKVFLGERCGPWASYSSDKYFDFPQCVSNFVCHYESVPIILIGNKADLGDRRTVSVSEAKKVILQTSVSVS